MFFNTRKGFSLTEVIIILTFIGITSGLSYFIINNITSKNREVAAITKAHTLNSSKISYKVCEVDAAAIFNAAINDEEKYQLLKSKNYLPMSEDSLNAFSISGYTYVLEDLDKRVTIINNKGEIVQY